MRFDLVVPALLAGVLLTASAFAEIKTEVVVYQDGDVKLEGFVAYDSELVGAADGKAPGVLVVHQWTGLTDYEKRRCRELAAMGLSLIHI